jgi:hypothetical protein
VESSSGSVAQDSGRAARERGGHPVAAAREAAVADGVDTGEHGMQAAGAEPVSDGVLADSEIEQLPPSDNAMLPTRHVGDYAVPRLR